MLSGCSIQAESALVDADIQKEFARQREHLERSVASLKKKLTKDSEIHRSDNVRIMQVNPGSHDPMEVVCNWYNIDSFESNFGTP